MTMGLMIGIAIGVAAGIWIGRRVWPRVVLGIDPNINTLTSGIGDDDHDAVPAIRWGGYDSPTEFAERVEEITAMLEQAGNKQPGPSTVKVTAEDAAKVHPAYGPLRERIDAESDEREDLRRLNASLNEAARRALKGDNPEDAWAQLGRDIFELRAAARALDPDG